MKKPVVLTILDGVAINEQEHGNAVLAAKMPNFKNAFANCPNTSLIACGLDVGLPEGQMGNSEVGHLNIGAGRTVYQGLTLINKAIDTKEFFKNKSFLDAINHVKNNNSNLHVMGLLSDGGVHSNNEHLYAILKLAKQQNLENVYIHTFLDGRDVAQDSAINYIKDLEAKIKEIGIGEITTISGRFFAMDRDNRWDRIKATYDVMCIDNGNKFDNPETYILDSYKEKVWDEFIKPAHTSLNNVLINSNDAIIHFNYRPDRAIELSYALTNHEFDEFDCKKLDNLFFVCMMPYAKRVNGVVAFTSMKLENTLGEVLAAHNLKQLRIAETEKYAHVTFFFDGGVDKEIIGSNRVLIKSPNVTTYDLQPEMSAYELTDKLLIEMDKDYDVIIINFANADMVGHSGKMEPTIKALEAVDECLGKIMSKVKELNGVMLITADHGNSDTILDAENNPITAHSTNPVPFVVFNDDVTLKTSGALRDIAPTILSLLNIEKPKEMDGSSLIK